MSGSSFRGTSLEQDGRFGKAEEKLIAKLSKAGKFSAILENKVNLKKVNIAVISKWITAKIIQLVGFEDDILINLVINMLEGDDVDPKKMQLDVTGFLEKQSQAFVEELWTLLVDAQKQASGIPSVFIEKKKEEILNREAAQRHIIANLPANVSQTADPQSEPIISKPSSDIAATSVDERGGGGGGRREDSRDRNRNESNRHRDARDRDRDRDKRRRSRSPEERRSSRRSRERSPAHRDRERDDRRRDDRDRDESRSHRHTSRRHEDSRRSEDRERRHRRSSRGSDDENDRREHREHRHHHRSSTKRYSEVDEDEDTKKKDDTSDVAVVEKVSRSRSRSVSSAASEDSFKAL